jgi:hypothetical protein
LYFQNNNENGWEIFELCMSLGVKKVPVVPVPDRPYFFLPTLLVFFNVIDRATLFSPGGCGLLIQRAIGNTHL